MQYIMKLDERISLIIALVPHRFLSQKYSKIFLCNSTASMKWETHILFGYLFYIYDMAYDIIKQKSLSVDRVL